MNRVVFLHAIVTRSRPSCPNPGGAVVNRTDGSGRHIYPYFGQSCTGPADCGQCFLDDTCSCQSGCCAPTGGIVGGYVCLNQSDFAAGGCDLTDVGSGKTIAELSAICDGKRAEGCHGFNNNGYLKRCVRGSCGAVVQTLGGHPRLVSCFRADTPLDQARPPGCAPPGPPAPRPGPSGETPYGGRCSVTASRPECTCSGIHPPFGPPRAGPVPLQPDVHFPVSERAERAALITPTLQSIGAAAASAVLQNPATGATATASVGGAVWGWSVMHIAGAGQQPGNYVVLEQAFVHWAELVYVFKGPNPRPALPIRKPVGQLHTIVEPVYALAEKVDPDYFCRQDIDPTDWLAKLAANMSVGGEEATPAAAGSVMAPNTDNGLFGNPEEYNKFTLTLTGGLNAMPWGGKGPQGHAGNGNLEVWNLQQYSTCQPIETYPTRKLGMVGRFLRAVNMAVWGTGDDGTPCGSEVIAVAPRAVAGATTSTALLKVSTVTAAATADSTNTTYLAIVTDVNGTKLVRTEHLGGDGHRFYDALFANAVRWGAFIAAGTTASIPFGDQRYADTALSLLTMYMNLNQGLVPEYGAGQFWNTYNINLPLDTLALGGALLEWDQAGPAVQYLAWFFAENVLGTGVIDYKNFGCDSDADYGRIIDLFASAVRYSGNVTFAVATLPKVTAMAKQLLEWRSAALAAYPEGNPLHGIVPGSPEHDICRAPGYFFSVNVWGVRGLLSLSELHRQYPGLSVNATFERALKPTADAWRDDIRHAANFTAVRRSYGEPGLYFLHPVVGSVYGTASRRNGPMPQLLPGGTEADCVNRTTCFASMTAGLPGGGSNQRKFASARPC